MGIKAKLAKKGIAAIVGICALLLMAIDFQAQAAELKVGIIGDQTWSRDLTASYRIMEQGISILVEQKPDIIVHTGDMVESAAGEKEVERNFRQASGLLDKSGVPWYLVAGDHDVNPPEFRPDSPDRSRETFFLSLCRQRLPVKDNLYYSFDRGPFHFIVLYSGEHLHTDPRWGNVFLSRISDRQHEWLREDLEAKKNREAIIVFVHQPLWYNRSGWSRVHRLLREYPVVAVVAGHFHYNQDEAALDGIRYVVVGATGAETKNAGPEAGGIHHVTIMTLNSARSVDFHPLAIFPPGEMAFGSRNDMDRVQALDYAMGAWEDSRKINKLHIKGNGLVNDCSSEGPARLKLGPFGNAVEVPLNITVDLRSTSPSIGLTSSSYDKKACVSADNRTCVMRPSFGIGVANTSSVAMDGHTPPLWEGILHLAGKVDATKGHSVGLDVGLSFSGENGKVQRLFHKTKEVPVGVCPDEGSGQKTDKRDRWR
jgi:predicted MPP superfamily phosphohydrolase